MVETNTVFPFPWEMGLQAQFYIPRRVQRERLPDSIRRWVDPGVERFVLRMDYTHGTPIAIVIPVGATKLDQGQSAMIVVREFIHSELQDNAFLFLDTVGPSPFHADFFVVPRSEDKEKGAPYDFEHIHHRRGPDELIFRYDKRVYDSAERALEDVLDAIDDQAQFFYSAMRGLQFDMVDWARLEGSVQSLIELHRQPGVAAVVKRLIGSSRAITETIIEVSQFETRQLFDRKGLESRYKAHFGEGEQAYLKPFLDAELTDAREYPARQTAELVRNFERWRTHTVDAIALLVSALLGGVIAALATQLLS